ncbi:MAG: hypothetical protein ACPGN3_06240 [Opitutales bacterium]
MNNSVDSTVHIGLHKTGSTSIQAYLRDNEEHLKNQGYLYPTKKTKSHNNIAFELNKSSRFDEGRESIKFLRRQISKNPEKRLILSAESFNSISKKSIERLIKHLPGEVTCIAYIRPQDEFLESIYVQRLKTGRADLDFESFLQEINFLKFADYRKKIFPWIDVLEDRGKVVLRSYSRQHLLNNDIISDFLSILGIEFLEFKEMQNNRSPGETAAAFMVKFWQEVNSRFTGLTPEMKDKLFGPKLRSAIGQNFTNDTSFSGFDHEERLAIRRLFSNSNQELFKSVNQSVPDWPISKKTKSQSIEGEKEWNDLITEILASAGH